MTLAKAKERTPWQVFWTAIVAVEDYLVYGEFGVIAKKTMAEARARDFEHVHGALAGWGVRTWSESSIRIFGPMGPFSCTIRALQDGYKLKFYSNFKTLIFFLFTPFFSIKNF